MTNLKSQFILKLYVSTQTTDQVKIQYLFSFNSSINIYLYFHDLGENVILNTIFNGFTDCNIYHKNKLPNFA